MLPADAAFRAWVRGIQFTGEPFRHKPGVYVREVEGTVSGGNVSSESFPHGDGDGQYNTPNRRTDPRIFTLSGFVYADTLHELGMMGRKLASLLAEPGDEAAFTWLEYGHQFHADVRRGSGFAFTRRGATRFADYTIRFRAPSQLYYGETESVSGQSVQVVQRGMVSSWPVIDVPGPHTGFTISGPGGRVYKVTQAAGAGSVHRIITRTGALLLNGAEQIGARELAYVWPIPPGQRVAMSITGAPSMTVHVAPAYA